MALRLQQPDFLPISFEEMKRLGWEQLDFLLVSGDAYVDHPSFGVALIGRLLVSLGYRTGIVAQPDWRKPESLKRMGIPRLACAVSSGNTDSMLNIYTAARRLRKQDEYSPGGKTGLRPPHATVVYAQLARYAFPGVPIIIGGLEASMRRIAHYDYWQDKMRPSILFDSKADILIYGMAEKALAETARRIENNEVLSKIRGTAVFLGRKASAEFRVGEQYVELPSYEECLKNKSSILKSAQICENESNPFCARGLIQWHSDRLVVVEPPQTPLKSAELDEIYAIPFSKAPHPSYKEPIPAFEMVKNSITATRGCPGGCSFCGISLHQGKFVTSRSQDSIIHEIHSLSGKYFFKGTISDIGGPTANCYGSFRKNPELCEKCRKISCLFPEICPNFIADEKPMLNLLDKTGRVASVKHVFIASGIRLDLAKKQKKLMREIIRKHVSGHLKVAPEHFNDAVLRLMRKNKSADFLDFLEFFNSENRLARKEQYLVPYFIANFPGSTDGSMRELESFLDAQGWRLRQVQDFIPLPMTMAAAMYYSGKDFNGMPIQVNRGLSSRRSQIKILKKKRR